jgi:hypothetical protein
MTGARARHSSVYFYHVDSFSIYLEPFWVVSNDDTDFGKVAVFSVAMSS